MSDHRNRTKPLLSHFPRGGAGGDRADDNRFTPYRLADEGGFLIIGEARDLLG